MAVNVVTVELLVGLQSIRELLQRKDTCASVSLLGQAT